MFREKSHTSGSKSQVVVFHSFISPTLWYIMGDGNRVVEVSFK